MIEKLCDFINVKIFKDDSCVAAAALNAQLSQRCTYLRLQVNKRLLLASQWYQKIDDEGL